MSDLKNAVNKKEISKNENPDKEIDIVEEILNFNKQWKEQKIKILTSTQMLWRLLIALAQLNAGNTPKNLLNEIRQMIYSVYPSNEISNKVFNHMMNLIKVQYKMDTIFMNSKNSKTSKTHRLLLNLTDKIILNRDDRYITLSNLSIYYTLKKYVKVIQKQ